ncbi:MAG TPA: hypothetical protein VGQ19_05040 [Burkholderiales bacterium]|jgi:hypothetical protein|nr:hypothetical protein [Burkholderiales bacterium]
MFVRPVSAVLPGLFAAALFAAAGAPQAQTRIASHSVVEFASVKQGREILGNVDDYVSRMGSFDRMLRLKTARAVSEREFLDFAMDNVLSWTAEEKARVGAIVASLAGELEKLDAPFPVRVLLVKTTGREEEGVAHTRANAVMLSQRSLGATDTELTRLLAHEFFHVISRHDRALRARAYRTIGFHLCPEITLPARLAPIRITNPDAPVNDAFIEVVTDGKPVPSMPVLLSRSPKFDPAIGRDIVDYWLLKLLVLEAAGATGGMRPVLHDGEPVLLAISEVSGFSEQVGRNTAYIIHPEEILADNFALMLTGRSVESPDVLRKLREVFLRR